MLCKRDHVMHDGSYEEVRQLYCAPACRAVPCRLTSIQMMSQPKEAPQAYQVTISVLKYAFKSELIIDAAYLDIIIEDQVLMLVALQQRVGILQLEIFKLQNCLGPPTHHRLHKLVQNLQPRCSWFTHASGIRAFQHGLYKQHNTNRSITVQAVQAFSFMGAVETLLFCSMQRAIAANFATAQHSTAQHSTAQHSPAQHSTAQHSTAQHSTAQHSTAQHSTAQHHSTGRHSPGNFKGDDILQGVRHRSMGEVQITS